MYSNENGSGWSMWGIAIFLLILFVAFFNGRGFGNNVAQPMAAGYPMMPWMPNAYLSAQENTTDRDVLKLETLVTGQTGELNKNLELLARTLLAEQEKNTAAILIGQKDQYIKQLEQQATQMFVTQQNEQTRNLIEAKSSAAEAKAQFNNGELNHRLDIIQGEMLKRPPFVPFGGLPVVGCNNVPQNSCGCNGFNAFAA